MLLSLNRARREREPNRRQRPAFACLPRDLDGCNGQVEVARNTMSVAVVPAVMIETGLNRHDLGGLTYGMRRPEYAASLSTARASDPHSTTAANGISPPRGSAGSIWRVKS